MNKAKSKSIIGAGLTGLAVAGALMFPGGASAISTTNLAKADCKAERLDDPGEFRRDYGTGSAAIRACIRRETKQARRECRQDRRYESAEFKREYGSGKKAFRSCVRAELR